LRVYCAILSIFLLSVLALPTVLSAQEADEEQSGKERADEYFSRGRVLFAAEEYSQAAEAFSRAQNIAPHAATVLNIALSYEKAGNLPRAVVHYREYLAAIGDRKKNKKTRKIEKQLAGLEGKVGELEVSCLPLPCQIRMDGVLRGDAPIALVEFPGLHLIEVVVVDEVVADLEVTVEAGRQREVELSYEETTTDSDELPLASAEDESEEKAGLGVPFWVASGVTVAAGVTSIVSGVLTNQDEDEFFDTGQVDGDLKESGERNRLITNIMIGVTAAAAVMATVFALKDLVFDKEGDEEDEESSSEPVSVIPGPGLGIGIAF
jgi:tetratricopeptide (TPR) repeat protein